MKKTICVLIAVLFLGLLAACGQDTTTAEDAGGNTVIIRFESDDAFPIDAEQLETAKEYITYRLEESEWKSATVKADKADKAIKVTTDTPIPDSALEELLTVPKLTFRAPGGEILMDGSYVSYAVASVYDSSGYVVKLTLTDEGRDRFAEITREYINQTVSIYLDDELIIDPTIVAEITDGELLISGAEFTAEDVTTLANKISMAALPYRMYADKG